MAYSLLVARAVRTSSYVIHVDLPDQPDHVLLIHGYTGAYDVVTRSVAAYLRANEQGKHVPAHGEWPEEETVRDVSPPSDATIVRLTNRGYLTDVSLADERQRVRELARSRHEGERQASPHYVLMPTYDCNLRCGYCFQDHMRRDPAYRHLLRAMDRPMIDRLLRGMDQIDAMHAGSRKERKVTVFGGEPLLASNRDIMEYLVERICGNGGSIFTVTNATELHHYLDLLRPDAISGIQVTIDGPPDEHDKRRIRPDGSGSFAAIMDNLVLAVERDVSINVRINTDRKNVDRLPELARAFAQRGLDKKSNFYAYAAAVHAVNENLDKKDTFTQYALTKRINELRAEFPEMHLIHRPADEVKRNIDRILRQQITPWRAFRASYCGAHSVMYVLDPFGDIYACWERTGDARIRIGHIDEYGRVELIRSVPQEPPSDAAKPARKLLPVVGKPMIAGVDAWRDRTFATNETCLSCKYAFYCGGGCAAEALDHKQEYYTNYCSGFQQKFRVAAAESYREIITGVQSGIPDALAGCGH